MNRKKFLLASFSALPAVGLARSFAAARDSNPFIVRSGQNRQFKPMMKFMGIHPNDVIISRRDTGGELSVFLFSGFKNAATSLHVHHHQDEFFNVIAGKYLFVCGDMKEELQTGDTIFLPRKIPHQWVQVSDTGSLIYGVNPAGTLEDMFVEFDKLTTQPSAEEINKIHQKHGMEMVGPPIQVG